MARNKKPKYKTCEKAYVGYKVYMFICKKMVFLHTMQCIRHKKTR